jgi:hypothetical protein
LYVGVECRGSHATASDRAAGPRPRDGDVERHDHVRLVIDVDRDYASWFELLVDSRGWTADRCWGDAAWNPPWYVARGESAHGAGWTIEAAVPIVELAAETPAAGAVWACSVRRVTPTANGQQSTTDEADGPGPEAYSLLQFE